MENKILISEIFGPVLQGEGKFVGAPSIFIRTFGCNLRCPSFGIHPVVTENKEVQSIIENLDKYEKLEELPLVETGCDTYYATYPEFKKFAKWYTVNELIEKLTSIVKKYDTDYQIDLVFTGGEPLLPKLQDFYVEFFNKIEDDFDLAMSIKRITFETNATQKLSDNFIDIVYGYQEDIYFSMSVKLPSSGHKILETFNPDIIQEYINISPESWLKFVVADESDVLQIKELVKILDYCEVYLMPCGGEKELFDNNQKEVYNLCIKYNFNFSPRLQVSVWNNGIGI
jgi:7-carboxy-7-deazaguanine synthase